MVSVVSVISVIATDKRLVIMSDLITGRRYVASLSKVISWLFFVDHTFRIVTTPEPS